MDRKPLSLLLIEPDKHDYTVTSKMLAYRKEQAFNVTWAPTLESALEALRQKRMDIVLLDPSFADCEPFDVFLKVHANAPDVAIIILTSVRNEHWSMSGVGNGAQDFLIKGHTDEEHLRRSLLFALKRKNLENEIWQTMDQNLLDYFENAPLGLLWIGPDGEVLRANQSELSLLGYTRQEVIGHHISEFHADRESAPDILNRLSRGETLRDYEARLQCRDGTVKDVLIDYKVVRRNQQVLHVCCMTRDVSPHKRADNRLALWQLVTQILRDSSSLTEATHQIIPAVCQRLEWDAGALWMVDKEADLLHCVDFYKLPALELGDFERLSLKLFLGPKEGLPGRVWISDAPLWIPDVAVEENFPRALSASKANIHGAFAFPIFLGTEVVAIMEFFSRRVRSPERDLLEFMSCLGSQISRLAESPRASLQSDGSDVLVPKSTGQHSG